MSKPSKANWERIILEGNQRRRGKATAPWCDLSLQRVKSQMLFSLLVTCVGQNPPLVPAAGLGVQQTPDLTSNLLGNLALGHRGHPGWRAEQLWEGSSEGNDNAG